MDLNQVLNQVLSVAKEELTKTANGNSPVDTITKAGGGAAVVGILSMLLGRNGGSQLAKLGSLAALGSMAYQAYQSYQAKQAQPLAEIQSGDFSLENQNDSNVVLQAMIAAAASDGNISDEEVQAIMAEAGDEAEGQQWLMQQLQQPASVAEIAQKVGNNQALAAQVYLAARMVCKEMSRKEIVFLANLAQGLGLNDQLVEELEAQAGF